MLDAPTSERTVASTVLLLASLLAAWTIHRARREYMEYRHLSSLTSVTASAVYALQTLLSALAAKKSWPPFTVGPAMRFGVGIPSVLVGLTFYAYGLISLRSPRPVAGLEAKISSPVARTSGVVILSSRIGGASYSASP